MLFVSLLLHTVSLSAVFYITYNEPRITYFVPVYTVDLVEPLPPKDKPGPKKTVSSPPRPAPTTTPKPTPRVTVPEKAKPEPVPPKAPEETISIEAALDKIALKVRVKEESELVESRIEEIERGAGRSDLRSEVDALKEEIAAYEAVRSTVEVESMSAPSAPSRRRGLDRELIDLRNKAYYNKMAERIESRWIFPGEPAEDIELRISIRISPLGDLIDSRIEKSSGDATLDESLMRAIKKAAPFPPPIEGMELDTEGLGIRFCPGGCKDKQP